MSDTTAERQTASSIERLRERLASQANLFDDPGAYLAGVEDTLARLQELDTRGAEAPAPPRWVRPADFHATVDGRPASRSDRARYLAALAIGLATAGRGHREIVDELIAAANGSADLLQQAARSVYALRVGEAEHRKSAEAMLLQAVIEAGPYPEDRGA